MTAAEGRAVGVTSMPGVRQKRLHTDVCRDTFKTLGGLVLRNGVLDSNVT